MIVDLTKGISMVMRDGGISHSFGKWRNRRWDRLNGIRVVSLEILRYREMLEGLVTLKPLLNRTNPLFEIAIEVACQTCREKRVLELQPASDRSGELVKRLHCAIDRVTATNLNLPERKSADFLDFWFGNDENEAAAAIASPAIQPECEMAMSNPRSLLLAETHSSAVDTLIQTEIANRIVSEDLMDEKDVGGDLNITLEFVHSANQSFNDLELLAGHLTRLIRSAGETLLQLLTEEEPES